MHSIYLHHTIDRWKLARKQIQTRAKEKTTCLAKKKKTSMIILITMALNSKPHNSDI